MNITRNLLSAMLFAIIEVTIGLAICIVPSCVIVAMIFHSAAGNEAIIAVILSLFLVYYMYVSVLFANKVGEDLKLECA